MTTYNALSADQIQKLKSSEIVINYNMIATLVGAKSVKKFRDHATGVKRLIAAQENLPEEKPKSKKPSKYSGEKELISKSPRRPSKTGSAMLVIQQGIDGGHNTIDKAITHFQENWTPPRSNQSVDYGFARGYVIGAIREGFVSIKKD